MVEREKKAADKAARVAQQKARLAEEGEAANAGYAVTTQGRSVSFLDGELTGLLHVECSMQVVRFNFEFS